MQTREPDPIIAEVRAIRRAYAARFDYDVDAIFKDLRARQEASGREYVRLPARTRRARHENSPPELLDLVPRFEGESSGVHVRNALGATGRLKDDGTAFWSEGTPQLEKWHHECDELMEFIGRSLGKRRHLDKQDLSTALREFVQTFEHSQWRLDQLLRSGPSEEDRRRILRWCDLIYRLSTYALIAFWIDDKTEHVATRISMRLDRTTGMVTEQSMETEVTKKMTVPKKYKKATQRLQ